MYYNPAASYDIGTYLWSIGAKPDDHQHYQWRTPVICLTTLELAWERIDAQLAYDSALWRAQEKGGAFVNSDPFED